MQKILPKIAHSDERGKIETIFAGKPFREINKFQSKKGMVRGNHYHKKTEELIYLLKGEVMFKIKHIKDTDDRMIAEDKKADTDDNSDGDEEQTHKTTLLPGDALLIEPYELHTAEILKDSEWISCLTKEYDEKEPDVFTD